MLEDERVQQAITKVAVLESRLNGHEDICSKRYGEIAAAFGELKGQLSEIKGSVFKLLVAALLLLLGAFGTVLYTGVKGIQLERVHE